LGGCFRVLSERIFRFFVFGVVFLIAKLSSSLESGCSFPIVERVFSVVKSIGSSDEGVSPLIDFSNKRFVSRMYCFFNEIV
jgi:hypothetical protein